MSAGRYTLFGGPDAMDAAHRPSGGGALGRGGCPAHAVQAV
jgi:hypothetical protein